MARISGVNIPNDKKVEFALTYIFGIGRTSSRAICTEANVDLDIRVKNLSEDEISRISNIIGSSYIVEGELRKEVSMNIKSLMDMKCYRGQRHILKLPTRGQRTRTNARTRKGTKRKPIAGKKMVTK